MSVTDMWNSLSSRVNKVDSSEETSEGVSSELIPELELDLSDEELIALTKKYKSIWEKNQEKISSRRKANESYWKGEQSVLKTWWGDERPLADNLIFESLETFLPVATRKNPEPIVDSAPDEFSQKLAEDVRKMLIFQTDRLRLKSKIKRGTRNWALYLVGAWKVGWNEIQDDVEVATIRPQKLILDPDATINEQCEYTGEFLGEYREATAEELKVRFPGKKELINELTRGEEGTKIKYIEWWTKRFVVFTLKNNVLAKYKNPHWNYTEKRTITDEFGISREEEAPGNNHFKEPKIPYIFLTVFDLQLHPWDETSLIEQNQRLQDIINKRILQIDRNATKTNGAILVSGDHYTQEEAGSVVNAMWDGDAAWVPTGNVNTAIAMLNAPALPQFVYQSMTDARQELRGIFGVTALTAQGLSSTETVRGKIMARTADDSRVGGGVTEPIEQVYDSIYNWIVQLMFVYYTEEHVASIMGEEGGREYISIRNDRLTSALLVSVKEGSLIPEDPLTKRNEAMDLWSAGAIDPITLFKRLGDPNPKKAAEQLFMWQSNPASLFPELAQAQAPAPQPGAPQSQAEAPVPGTLEEAQTQAGQASALSNVPIDGGMPSI